MFTRGKLSTATAQMGQSASQPETSILYEQGEDEDIETGKRKLERRKEKKGKKDKKRKRAFVANASQEEESAHALLELRGDILNGVRQPSHDDDLAASLQLQVESSPSRLEAPLEIESTPLRHNEEINGDAQASEGRKKKRKRQALDNSTIEEEILPEVAEHRRSKHAKITPHSTPPAAAQSLDQLNSEDEAIASYLREYENDQAIAPFSPHSEDVESTSEMDNLAATVARDESPVLMQSTYQLPSHSSGSPDRTKRDQQIWKQGSGSYVGGEGTDIHDLPNGTGQHAFDEEAFDECLSNLLNSANGYDQAPSYDIPVDPRLTGNGDGPIPGAELSLTGMDVDFTEAPASNKKISRVYPSRKRRPAKETPNTDIYALPRDDSPELDHEHQDQIMPGIEDMRSHISDSGSLVGDSNKQASSRSSSEVVMLPEKTPPPLAKRSKPRGNKTQQGGRKTKNHNTPLTQIAQKGGMFTQIEMTKLDALRDAYCEEHGVTTWKFNELIHAPVRGNHDVLEVWESIHELFPYRTRMSLSRFCRRRFHNFSARGIWTQSEDEMLERAVAEKGNSWKAVGALINRFPEDCRDRYRNYHVNAANRNREQWTEAEVKNLCWAVYDCMMKTKEEKRRAKQEEYHGRDIPESERDSDQEIEEMKLINWQAVSDRMGNGGARSRLQCSSKWGKLKIAERDSYMREVRALMKSQKRSERRKARKDQAPWRLQRAMKKLKNMKSGDRYDFLQAISNCDVENIENIPWRLLGDEEFRARWTTTERKAAWEIFKKEVPGADAMDYRAVIKQLLTEVEAEDGDRLHERWDPSVDGDINLETRARRKEKRKGKRVNGVRQEQQQQSDDESNRYKSKAIVESDVGDQHSDDQEDQPSNEEAETPASSSSNVEVENEANEEDGEDSTSPNHDDDDDEDDANTERNTERSDTGAGAGAGGGSQQSTAEDQDQDQDQDQDHDSDDNDSLFRSNSDDGHDEGLFVS